MSKFHVTHLLAVAATVLQAVHAISNPILPGFNPDPSCMFEASQKTFFCATSTFNAFPGIPIYASKDLASWRLVSNVLSRNEQLPEMSTKGNLSDSTSGIWAPTLRHHEGTWYLFTTLVLNRASPNGEDDPGRYNNVLFTTKDIWSGKWSDAKYFSFVGYDPSPFWHEDGTLYMLGGTNPKKGNHTDWFTLDLDTMETTTQQVLWNGTYRVPEGPHIYYREPWYYLLAAEGGTGVTHEVTMARSQDILGPYENAPENPLLSNYGTTSLYQTVGHADLFQDEFGNWWSSALSTRGALTSNHPMGRETVLTNVSWPTADDFPVFENVSGTVGGPTLPKADPPGTGRIVASDDNYSSFGKGPKLPSHFLHWRLPNITAYTVNPKERPGTLRLSPSSLNLTGLDGETATSPQTYVGRRQEHSVFEWEADLEFVPQSPGDEAGVTVFTSQARHIEFGLRCPLSSTDCATQSELHIYSLPKNKDSATPISNISTSPVTWKITVLDQATYSLSYGGLVNVTGAVSEVSAGYDGAMLGVYSTSNGQQNGTTSAYIHGWRYKGISQTTS